MPATMRGRPRHLPQEGLGGGGRLRAVAARLDGLIDGDHRDARSVQHWTGGVRVAAIGGGARAIF